MAPRWKVPCLSVRGCCRSLFKSLPLILATFPCKNPSKAQFGSGGGWFIAAMGNSWLRAAAGLDRCCFGCRLRRREELFPPDIPSLLPDPITGLPRQLLPPRPERKNHKPVEPRLMFCLKITFGGPWPVPKTSALSGRNFSSALAAAKRLFVPPDTWQELFERVPPPPWGKNTQWEPQAARNKPTDERGM